MLISEIFYSIQGEGELTGVPTVFVRTSGCNLRCVWCDTPYASWRPEGSEMSIEDIVAEVRRHPAAHVVLTGGEPMIARGIHELAAALRVEKKHITIETAGTVAPDGIACDLASISPKLANSTPDHRTINPSWVDRHERTRFQPDVLAAWVRDYDCQFKFVVREATDLREIDEVLSPVREFLPPWKVLLMPEGTIESTISSRQSGLVELCKSRGFRFCDRLQIRLFGNTKGT